MKLAFLRFVSWCSMRLGIYGGWSKVYQFLFERKTEPLKRFLSMADLVNYLATLKWRPDTWRQLWDAFSSPYHVQWLATNQPEHLVGDCDDFAIYEAAVLAEQPWLEPDVDFPHVLTVSWMYSDPAPGELSVAGHNVCLRLHKDGQFSWMDYGWPRKKVGTVQEAVQQVLSIYAPGAVLIRWGRCDRNLHYFETGTTC